MKNSMDNEFSLALLLEVAQGDDAFIREMILLFLKKAPEMLLSLNSAFEKNDLKECSNQAHKLKSSVQIIGNKELQEILKTIENYAKLELPRSDLSIYINALNEKMAQLFDFLNKRIEDPTKFS